MQKFKQCPVVFEINENVLHLQLSLVLTTIDCKIIHAVELRKLVSNCYRISVCECFFSSHCYQANYYFSHIFSYFHLLQRIIPRVTRQPPSPTTTRKNSASDIGSDRPTSMTWVRESSGARLSRSKAWSATRTKRFTRTVTTPVCTEILGAENTGIDRWALRWRNRHYHRLGGTDQRVRIFVNLSHSEWTQPSQTNRHLPGMRTVFGDTRWRLSHFHFARCSPSTSAGRLCQLEMGWSLSRLLNDQDPWSLMSVMTLTRWDKTHIQLPSCRAVLH